MKNNLESLNQEKFKPLSIPVKLTIRGGTKTAGDKIVVRYENGPNGTMRDYIKQWGSDEIDGKDLCYYDVNYYWTEWY